MRYDFSTAAKLLEMCQELKQRYGGITKLMAQSKGGSELSARLQETEVPPFAVPVSMLVLG